MKKLLFLISLFGSQALMSQFDRVLVDPISKFPSFAGNEGKTRLSVGYSESNLGMSSPISLDFFSEKMKGAYGVSLGYATGYSYSLSPSLIYNGSVVYSPKLTFKKKDQTWAPAIGFKYGYRPEGNSTIIDTNGNTIKESYAGFLSLSPYLGMSVNTNKSLVAYSFVGNRNYSVLQNNFMASYKIDANSSNAISSTLSSELEVNIKYKGVKQTTFTNPLTGNLKPVAAKFRVLYDLNLSGFYLSQGIHFSSVKYEYMNYPILGEATTINESTYFSTRAGYKGNKFSAYLGLKYGNNKKNIDPSLYTSSKVFFGTTFSF